MQFDPPLVAGRLIRRYKRFLADVELDSGQTVTASCPNTGSMAGLTRPGNRVWLSLSDNPKRKYAHAWQLVECSDIAEKPLVGINTHLPNRLVEAAINAGTITPLAGYSTLRREIRYGTNSRIDLLLEDSHRPPCYIEIKSVTYLRQPGLAEFPDAKTARGAKHLAELARMAEKGARAVLFYLIQRDDADRFCLARDIDPDYQTAYIKARKSGVETLAWSCKIDPNAIVLNKRVTIETEKP